MGDLDINSLIGKEFNEELECFLALLNLDYRIVSIDGRAAIATADYVPDRINLKIDAGIITDVRHG